MIDLRLLGTVRLEGLPPARARAVLAQPKRFALLVGLTLSAGRTGRGCSRDELTALLWVDRSKARARGALRNALHGLRSHLGREVIRSTGDRLEVDERWLSCDAQRFEMLVAEGRLAEAVALYEGDLLPGFAIQAAPFATWLDEARDRLRESAAQAEWVLAEREEQGGNLVSAADHARRATRFSKDGEGAVRRLMRLLDRAGDRVAALQEYESFCRRWKQLYGMEPSSETRALSEAIRQGTLDPRPSIGGRTPPGWRSTVPERFASPPRMAVMPFLRVGSDTEGDHLAVGLADGVVSALSRVSGVRVVARGSVDRIGEVRQGGAKQVGEQLDVDLVLDGSLRVAGDRLGLAVRLVDARSGAPLWADVYEAGRSDLLSLQTDLVREIVRVLGVSLSADQERHLARPPTVSAEAYELYLRGRRKWNRRSRSDMEAALGLYEEALALDSSFALAWVGLADAYLGFYPAAGRSRSEARIRAREAARQALDLDPRLGEAHATLGLLRCVFDRDWHAAETEFLRAIELSPGYATAHHWYGGVLSWVFRRFEEGARELELARQLDPMSPIIHNDIGMALLNQGRIHQALGKFEEALAIDPDFWRAHYDLGITAAISGDHRRALRHLQCAWRLGAYGADPGRAQADAATLTWREALERKLDELATRRSGLGTRGFEAAVVSMLLEHRDRAIEWLWESEREGSTALVAQYYPVFEPLAGRPAFAAILERLGLQGVPQAQRD